MNPYLLTTLMRGLLRQKRACPECKRGQLVPASKKKETVRCKFCGASIPPAE